MNIYILYLLRTVMVKLLHRDLRALLRIVYLCLDGEIQTNLFIIPAGFKKQELVPNFSKKIIYQITGHQWLQNLFFYTCKIKLKGNPSKINKIGECKKVTQNKHNKFWKVINVLAPKIAMSIHLSGSNFCTSYFLFF